jgi:NADPH:quinone reductase-like Zn-dependent oxidoreductase
MSCEIDEQPKCRQGEVRQNSARVIDLIEHDAAVKNPGTRKLQAFLAKLSSGKLEHARGLRYRCSKIGDMLIALGCPEGAKIVSADGSFAELGRIIGRDVGILPSLAALMVARETKGAA